MWTVEKIKEQLGSFTNKRKLLRWLKDNAKDIGGGCQRRAFLLGKYVIKRDAPAWAFDMKENEYAISNTDALSSTFIAPKVASRIKGFSLKIGSIRYLKGHAVNGWLIQPYCRKPKNARERNRVDRIGEVEYDVFGDIHSGNVGFYRGKLYVFDW